MELTRYAAKALEGEVALVAGSGQGGRNCQLFSSAHSLGRLVGGGELRRSDVEEALLTAALSVGLDRHEAETTIRSGLAKGEQVPRKAPVASSRGRRGTWQPLGAVAARPGRPAGQGGGAGAADIAEWTPRAVAPPPALWMEKAGAFLGWCQERLTRTPALLAWLEKSRGLRPETVRAAGLGWNPGDRGRDLYRPRSAWGLPVEMNDRGQERKLWLPLGLVLPYVRDGVVVRLKIRRPKAGDALPPELAPPHEHGPKWARSVPYAAIPGSAECSFFLPGQGIGDRPMPVAVVESELDALLLQQAAGDLAHVLAMGSASNRPDASVVDVLHAAPAILLCLDFDDAGASAASWWLERFPRAEVWPVPEGKDPNEARLAGHDLRAWLEGGLPARPCLPGRSGGAGDAHAEGRNEHLVIQEQARGPAECWL